MLQFLLLVSRQGKTRVAKWYLPMPQKERQKVMKEVLQIVLSRSPKLCNFVEWREYTLIFKRYASLFFIACVDKSENELVTLELIHHFVEILDRYFGNVCELDLIFNFHKAYYLLDELVIAGEVEESSKKTVLRVVLAEDAMMEESKEPSAAKKLWGQF